jgi:hypothetical protein
VAWFLFINFNYCVLAWDFVADIEKLWELLGIPEW